MDGPVAVTGAGGRLGRALLESLGGCAGLVVGWSRPGFDLDDPASGERLLERDRPRVVIHAAAWTDVDGCARDPELAHKRNGAAVGALARACVARAASLVLISTNEVFDGQLRGRGYREDDAAASINAYGASKLAGETAAREAFRAAGVGGVGDAVGTVGAGDADGAGGAQGGAALWIIRTAWLFGPPGADFPARILAAADRLPPGALLPGVIDEVGSPTLSSDLADAIVSLLATAPPGIYHLVNGGMASRYAWAERVLARFRGGRPGLQAVRRSQFQRASEPPAWAVLDASLAASLGIHLRDWEAAFDAYAVGSGASEQ
ncbi:MAG: SDR family oxidoreductase [Candidatus Limnocylindrales bacterium]